MRTKPRNIIATIVVVLGVVWYWAKQIGLAIFWFANLFGKGDDLRSLWCFLTDLGINQVGPWVLMFGGAASLVWINAGPYLKAKIRGDQSEQWAQICDDLASEISEFVFERETMAPAAWPDNEADLHDGSYNRFKKNADHSNMTRRLYTKKFASRLYDLVNYLSESGHKPAKILTFGEDSWAEKKVGMLASYARLLREGKTIDDEEGR